MSYDLLKVSQGLKLGDSSANSRDPGPPLPGGKDPKAVTLELCSV